MGSMGTFGILFLLVYPWSLQIFSSVGIFYLKCLFLSGLISVILSLSFTRNHIVMHRTQRNLLNNSSGNTPPKNMVFRYSRRPQTALSKWRIFSLVPKIVFLGANDKSQWSRAGSELDNTGPKRLSLLEWHLWSASISHQMSQIV